MRSWQLAAVSVVQMEATVFWEERINTFKTETNLNYVYRFSSYRAVNTPDLCYKIQSINAV